MSNWICFSFFLNLTFVWNLLIFMTMSSDRRLSDRQILIALSPCPCLVISCLVMFWSRMGVPRFYAVVFVVLCATCPRFLYSCRSCVMSSCVVSVLCCLVFVSSPSRLVLSCLVLSCLVLSCLVLSCLVLSSLVLSSLLLSSHVSPRVSFRDIVV